MAFKRKRRSRRNVFGKKIARKGARMVSTLSNVGLIENRMCPIFSNYPFADIAKIGGKELPATPGGEEVSHKNPWADTGQGRIVLQPTEDGNILSDRAHFGLDYVLVKCIQTGPTSAQFDQVIERPLSIGLLPRMPLGPLRFGGVEGKYIFLKHLNLRFNFRYERPKVAANITGSQTVTPILPPMKVSIMIVKQREGDIGEKYKQAIEHETKEGDPKLAATSAKRRKVISGNSDFLGDNLLMDPLGQPFGVGKRLYVDSTTTPPNATMRDRSTNGVRNGSFYFHCPVQRKWFTVLHSSTFTLGPQQQPNIIPGPLNTSRGFNNSKSYRSSKTVSFNLPIKNRVLMKPLALDRFHPEGTEIKNFAQSTWQNANPTFVSTDHRLFPQVGAVDGAAPSELQSSIYGNPNSETGPISHPIEWMAPADVDMSDYHVVVKAYSFTETPADNNARLSGKFDTAAQGFNGPLPNISYGMTGRMSYNDV